MHGIDRWFQLTLAILVAASPVLEAQGRGSTRVQRADRDGEQRYNMTLVDDDRTLKVRLDGRIELNDDDTDVVSVADGATLVIEEQRRGEPARHIEFRGQGGAIRRSYTVNGAVREGDADQKAWLARILPELAREYGLNAERRVQRILRREGVDGVLREIRLIRSDGGKRTYLRLLMQHATLTGAQTVAALGIVERISSDGDKAGLLRQLLPGVNLADAGARGAFFDAASSISSDGDRSSVLLAVIRSASPDAATLTALLGSAAGISSDGDRSRVLIAAARTPVLESGPARDAWFRAAGGISSDGDRSRALLAILHQHGERAEVTVQALRSAREISSDGDKTRVLLAVAPEQLRDARVAAAYDSALDSISSDGEHRRAELHVRSARSR